MPDTSLFGLISLAGNASLGELRARSSVDDSNLAHQLADLVRDGSVELTAIEPGAVLEGITGDPDSGVIEFIKGINQPLRGPVVFSAAGLEDSRTKAIQTALGDDVFSTSITVSPTASGFRRRL